MGSPSLAGTPGRWPRVPGTSTRDEHFRANSVIKLAGGKLAQLEDLEETLEDRELAAGGWGVWPDLSEVRAQLVAASGWQTLAAR
eukprot:7346626-Alexandrium_andersonii.AAC.1